MYTYDYPKVADLAADIIVLRKNNSTLEVLLIKRRDDPFKDHWALPGGYFNVGESPEQAAIRELEEETSIKVPEVYQFRTYGDPKRDPRGHVISVVHFVYVLTDKVAVAGDDAKELQWWDIYKLPPLAFDHEKIIYQWLMEY